MRRASRAAILASVIGAGLAGWARLGPLPSGLLDEGSGVPSTIVLDRNGVVLYEARASDGTRGVALDPQHLPPVIVQATVAAEDRRFYRHPGVDPLALVRAAWRNLVARHVAQGGSTITQQVVKLLLARQQAALQRDAGTASLPAKWGGAGVRGVRLRPDSRRSFLAKIHEAVLALRLEHRLSKQRILALYLDLAPYGNQFVGVERASRGYFGCGPGQLTPAQAAFLAGLPQRPTGFNPYRSRPAAGARGREVLARMAAIGFLSAGQLREAIGERLAFSREAPPFAAPHFVEMVLSQFGERRPGRVLTTLDAALQEEVEGIIRSQRPRLQRHGAHNVAVVVLENATGDWLAWEGSGDYFDAEHSGAIDGALADRQPGSALKPFTYALAFERGYTPATVLPDVPSHFPTAERGVAYTPRNYDGRYRGPLRARAALAGSENVPAVAVASDVGVPNLLRLFKRAGLATFDKTSSYYGLGVTLGDAEVKLAELTGAYAALARGGVRVAPRAVLDRPARGAAGEEIVCSPTTAFWVTDILSDGDAREYVFGRGGSLDFPFPVAVKTGTSQAYHDNWTIGYTRHVTVGVWVGNFDRTPLENSSGVTGAGPIFHGVMLAAERRVAARVAEGLDLPILAPPEGLVRQKICSLSGIAAGPACPSRVMEWLPPGHREDVCSWHHASDEGLIVVWPAQYRAWAAEQGMLMERRRPIPAGRASLAVGASLPVKAKALPDGQPRLAILNPPPGAVFLIDPTLRPEFQALQLRARPSSAGGRVEWQVDGRPVGTADSDKPFAWPLSAGRHTITARDGEGHSDAVSVLVK